MHKLQNLRHLLITLIFCNFGYNCYAIENSVDPFPNKNYLSFGYTKNYPLSDSQQLYKRAQGHPSIGFRHFMDDWLLGLSTHFKFFDQREDNSELALWTLEQETLYRFRVYHPIHFLMGAKLMYIIPSKKGMVPIKKRDEMSVELGVAGSALLLVKLNPSWVAGVYVDRWRGTGTKRLQGLELGFQLMTAI